VPYLTPQELPEDDDCRPLSIPANSEWLALFGGALTELTKTWNWEYSGGLTIAETVAKMNEIIDNWYTVPCAACTTPGGYRVVRINSDGQIEQLNDEGEWEPATDEYYIPPPEAREGGTEADQICLAAKNAVNVLAQVYEAWSDAWSSELSTDEIILAGIAIFIALVGFAIAPITWAIAAFLYVIFEGAFKVLEYATADLWDANFTDVMVCILRNCASNDGGVVTFDWNCLNDAIDAQVQIVTLTDEQLRLFAQVGYLMYFIGGTDGLNLAGATTAITDDNCDECGWCIEVDFREVDGGLYPFANENGDYATWISGEGWRSRYFPPPGNDHVQAMGVCLTLPFSTLLNKIIWNTDGYGATNTANALYADCLLSDFRADDGEWDGEENWITMSIYTQWYPDASGSQYIYLRSMSLRGVGDKPDLDGWTTCI